VSALRWRLSEAPQSLALAATARDTLAALLPSDALMQAISLAHDLGHPPFGHGGEVALHFHLRHHGGFEGNGQTLRLLARLEAYTPAHGMNLTRRTLLGVLKYPLPYSAVVEPAMLPANGALNDYPINAIKPPKCYLDTEASLVEWLLAPFSASDRARFTTQTRTPGAHGKPVHKGFDTALMELADDIAYGVHDLEDAVCLGLVTRDDWMAALEPLGELLPDWFDPAAHGAGFFGPQHARKAVIGEIVHRLILGVSIEEDAAFNHPLLRFTARLPVSARALLDALHGLVVRHVIELPAVQMLEFKGQRIVGQLFEVFVSDPARFLPVVEAARVADAQDEGAVYRLVADTLAGFTDEQAVRVYQKLFMPRMGSVFDVL
jgi:dGTPase